ncbi:hypothetical protein [Sphingomonas crocodyli]|uniref:hypothetical protein n=1 Tax=Sphingomonas crocodyli TaxID=1979270 RepID=UPI0013E3EEFA|nr:hypothetical protein [Sphingomonas crocodyli]
MNEDLSLRATLMADRAARRQRRLLGRLSLRDFWQAVDPKEDAAEQPAKPEPKPR